MTRKQAERQLDKTKEEIAYGVQYWNDLTQERQWHQSKLHGRIHYLEAVLETFDRVDKAVETLEKYDNR